MSRIHLDHNATTSMRPEVRTHFLACLDRLGGNPSSVHRAGRAARQMLDEARERTAAALGVHEDEIVFTAGGTESNNLALLGSLQADGRGLRHDARGLLHDRRGLLTTAVEHSSVLGAAEALERAGQHVERVHVDPQSFPDVERLLQRARDGGFGLVSVIAGNNEVGALSDLARVGAGLRELGRERPTFHTDAVQALGRIALPLAEWGIDLASFSAHKVGGPLGAGVLYKRKGLTLHPIQFGGGQEGGLRPGTENVPALCAASLAIELAIAERADYHARTRALCLSFWRQVQSVLPEVHLLGPPIDSHMRLPNTLNLLFDGIDGRMLIARLDLEGLEASAGSACASGSLEPSHVLLAMGVAPEQARSGLRVSLGRTTTAQDINSAVDILRRTLAAVR